jgi:hypothetical protein
MKQYFVLLFTFIPLFLFAQNDVSKELNKDYRILLSNGTIQLESQVEEQWAGLKNKTYVMYDWCSFVLVQFNGIPSQAEKEIIAKSGVQLLHYIPHYAWVAKIAHNVTSVELENLNIRALSEIKAEWKMPRSMQHAEVPAHAGHVDLLSARILFWKNATEADYANLCGQYGFEVENSSEEWSWVEVNTDWKSLVKFAEHPLVQYIEWHEAPTENEFLDEVTLIQSNYISDNLAKGLFFNGAGVDIAVNEGGFVDSAHSANFIGRLDRTLETGNVSGHKTGVGRRMASAGNLNPIYRGTAFGANLHSGGINFSNAATGGISIVNNSFGWGCIGSGTTQTYNSGAETNDNLVRNNPSFMITYSCGNNGANDCGYGGGAAGAGWGNITGLTKSAKNIFAVGSLNTSGDLTGFSSRGPAWDGRILPDICATGPGGTSHASPNLAGIFGQLVQAYRFHNTGITPNSGLLKAILMNSADDIMNPGPDFKTGYGKVNARKAYHAIANNTFMSTAIAQGGANTHNIMVPANVKQVRVMLYWTDYEATAGISSRALVNDLDMRLEDPSTTQWQPWVLNPTPDSATLEMLAIRTTDTLNNVEQVTLENPVAGSYTLHVDGTMVPQGPQEYFVVYEFVYDELFVTYPLGGEHFVASSTERVRWDSQGDTTNTFDLSYSIDNGSNWTSMVTGLAADSRQYDWSVPDTNSSMALIRVQRGTVIAQSDTVFDILAQPQNLSLIWTCADSSLLYWDSLAGVDGYIIYQLGVQNMDSIGYTTSNSFIANNLSLVESDFLAIAAVKSGAISRRTIAFEREPGDFNCTPSDIALVQILNPSTSVLPACATGNAFNIEILIRNWGINTLSFVPLAFSLDGAVPTLDTAYVTIPSGAQTNITFTATLTLTIGDHLLEVWTYYPNDGNMMNDTLSDSLTIYNSVSATLPLIESFDGFTTCSTAWGCESISCNLSQGFYNVTNIQGDDIDWRTHTGATGSGGTGPDDDHTTGVGNYLYLEGSGNSGSGCQNNQAALHSPCLDLTNAIQPELSFWYHAYGGAIGSMHVDVIANGVLHSDVVNAVNGEQGNQWDSLLVDLSPFIGSEAVIVFRGYTGAGYQADLAIDDINIYDLNLTNIAKPLAEQAPIFKVYPNPTTGLFTVDLGTNYERSSIYVSNVLGQVISQKSYSNYKKIELQLDGPAAVYFVTIKTISGESSTLKLVKQ